jgi:hypothetical protein
MGNAKRIESPTAIEIPIHHYIFSFNTQNNTLLKMKKKNVPFLCSLEILLLLLINFSSKFAHLGNQIQLGSVYFDVKWFLSENIFREVIFPENVLC